MKSLWFGGLVMVVVAMVAIRPGQAGNDDDARRLKDEINKRLATIADLLRDAASSSSGEDAIERSRSEADSVKSQARALRDVAGDDSTARQMADRYPDYADRYRESAAALKQLRRDQRTLDELPRLCEDKERELQDRIKPFVERNNPAGTDEVPRLAQQIGRPIYDRMADAERKRSDLQSLRDQALRFSDSDGGWSDVRSRLRDSTDQMFGYFNNQLERARRACADLSKLEKHPAVENALRQLMQGERGRQDLYQDLDRKLENIARTIESAARSSSTSEVEKALDLAGDLQNAIDKLSYVKGEDRKAGEMASTWPRYQAAYREAARQLLLLKQNQFRLDTAPDKCKKHKEDLQAMIKQYVDRHDPNGVDDILRLAQSQGATLTAAFASANDEDSRMQSLRSNIAGVSLGDGKWREISTSLKRTSDEIYAYWKQAIQKAHDACDTLALGERSPQVVKTAAMMQSWIPPRAQHASEHDRTCTGVAANGFCTADDQCLDGKCSSNKCVMCPSRDNCHPPGTCDASDYERRRDDKEKACTKPFSPSVFKNGGKVDCNALMQLCNNGQACLNNRDYVQQCFRGGDERHIKEANKVSVVVKECEALLKEKREKNLCQ